MQADVARAQSAEQVLHLQITALNLEMKQKNDQLAELRTAKAQMEAEMRTAKKQLEEQLAAAKAEAAAGKSLADRAMDDLKDSLAAQQATIKPAADSALAPVPTPQVFVCLYWKMAKTLLQCLAELSACSQQSPELTACSH